MNKNHAEFQLSNHYWFDLRNFNYFSLVLIIVSSALLYLLYVRGTEKEILTTFHVMILSVLACLYFSRPHSFRRMAKLSYSQSGIEVVDQLHGYPDNEQPYSRNYRWRDIVAWRFEPSLARFSFQWWWNRQPAPGLKLYAFKDGKVEMIPIPAGTSFIFHQLQFLRALVPFLPANHVELLNLFQRHEKLQLKRRRNELKLHILVVFSSLVLLDKMLFVRPFNLIDLALLFAFGYWVFRWSQNLSAREALRQQIKKHPQLWQAQIRDIVDATPLSLLQQSVLSADATRIRKPLTESMLLATGEPRPRQAPAAGKEFIGAMDLMPVD